MEMVNNKFVHLEYTKQEFNNVANSQEQKGIEKYGQALDPVESNRNWLDMEFEELVDAAKYNRAMKERIEFVTEKIKTLAGNNCDLGTYSEIEFWLEFLEGK